MRITVNNQSMELFEGAKVSDAIRKYYVLQGKSLPKVLPNAEDRFGNPVAGDGELTNGNMLKIKPPKTNVSGLLTLWIACLFIGSFLSCNLFKTSDKQVEILAVNDMHGAIDNFPKFAAIVDSLRDIYPDLIVLSAGDNQTGNPVNDQYQVKGLPMIELMNAVGFNLSAVGNHEFDFHYRGFSKLIKVASFDFLCANIEVPDSIDLPLSPYKIVTMPNGLRVCFVSVLHINANGIPDSHPENVKGLGFRSPFEVALEWMKLKDQCDIFIHVSHQGIENDVKLAELLPPGVDLIIGGHSHTRIDNMQMHNGVMITQAGNKLKYATLIKLNVSEKGVSGREMELIDVRKTGRENEQIRAMVDRYNDNPKLNEVIATASDDFSSSEELGYLMADALREGTESDIALVNPGGVRMDALPRGDVRIVDVLKLDPFGNDIIMFNLTGHEIKALMFAAFNIDDKNPLFPSGIRTKVRTDETGNLVEVELFTDNGEPIDMDKLYKVSMNSYMASVYTFESKDKGHSLYITTANNMIEYLKKTATVKSYRGEKRVMQ